MGQPVADEEVTSACVKKDLSTAQDEGLGAKLANGLVWAGAVEGGYL